MGSAKNFPMAGTSNARYVANLIQAGLDGVISARKATDLPAVSIKPLWIPAAIGAALGAWSGSRSKNSEWEKGVAVGGLLGCALGLACGFAWASRNLVGAVAQRSIRGIDAVRDVRWLEKNPINYA